MVRVIFQLVRDMRLWGVSGCRCIPTSVNLVEKVATLISTLRVPRSMLANAPSESGDLILLEPVKNIAGSIKKC